MVMCAVVNCSKRSGRDKDVSLYRLPAVISNQCSKTLELSTKRRQLWLSRISRQDLTVEKLDNARVCNLHFINGKPSHLFQELSPDWAPSLNLGHNKVKSTDISTVRYERASKRKAVKAERCATVRQVHKRKTNVHPPVPCMSLDGTEEVHDLELQAANDIEFPLSVSCQTSIETSNAITQTEFSSFEIDRLLDEIQALRSEKHTLNERLLNGVNFSADAMKDEAKVKFYTGLPNFAMLMALFNYCASFISSNHRSALPKFEELMIVLMRLRLNLQMQDIAFRFQISQPTVSRIFSKWLDVLYFRLKPLIRWPLREHLMKSMPMSFKTAFGNKVAVIIDCFEVFIERPSSLLPRAMTWSQYKHHNTAKFLIGITPQGTVSFLSEGWGGRVSDKHLTEHCTLLDNLVPGDVVMADRGFDIADTLGFLCAKLMIPAFTRGKSQLSMMDVVSTRKIASLRIHVERVIGLVRMKYSILSGTLSIETVTTRKGMDCPQIDKITTICCALSNMCEGVVPLE